MPMYEYKCLSCGREIEELKRVSERHQAALCSCGGLQELQISHTANAYVSGYPYFDPILDMEVTDPGHRRKVLKQQGLEERG